MPKRIQTIISKDGNSTEHPKKSVATEHTSTMEPVTEKNPKIKEKNPEINKINYL